MARFPPDSIDPVFLGAIDTQHRYTSLLRLWSQSVDVTGYVVDGDACVGSAEGGLAWHQRDPDSREDWERVALGRCSIGVTGDVDIQFGRRDTAKAEGRGKVQQRGVRAMDDMLYIVSTCSLILTKHLIA